MPKPIITDICLVTRDIDEAICFYTEKLGFELATRMPGFADFAGPGVILAVWDGEKIRESTGVPAQVSEPDGHGVMVAVELESPDAIDEMYGQLRQRGTELYGPPTDYPWNARCIYLAGPCGEFWEFFAWHPSGKPGQVSDDSS